MSLCGFVDASRAADSFYIHHWWGAAHAVSVSAQLSALSKKINKNSHFQTWTKRWKLMRLCFGMCWPTDVEPLILFENLLRTIIRGLLTAWGQFELWTLYWCRSRQKARFAWCLYWTHELTRPLFDFWEMTNSNVQKKWTRGDGYTTSIQSFHRKNKKQVKDDHFWYVRKMIWTRFHLVCEPALDTR